MRAILALAFCSVAFAQGDAREVLQQISDAARAMNSFRVEGVISTNVHAPGNVRTFETTFNIAAKRPGYVRNERNSGSSPTLTVCDDVSQWFYISQIKTYTKKSAADGTACTPTFLNWEYLMEGLSSATFDGRDRATFEGYSQECEIIRADYAKMARNMGIPATGSSAKRTLCVNRARNLILRDEMRDSNTTAIVQLSSAQLNPDLEPRLFAFVPPEGSKASEPLPRLGIGGALEPLPPGVSRVGGGVSAPVVISKVDPAYSAAGRKNKINGTVILSVIVQADGTPSNLHVLRSLEPSLDANAIEAVSQWRFRPATKAGVPVAVQANIEVNFRLSNDAKPPQP